MRLLGELRERLDGRADLHGHAVLEAGARDVAARDLGELLADLEAGQATVFRQAAGDADRAVAGEGADLDRDARVEHHGQDRQQPALVGARLHLRVGQLARSREPPARAPRPGRRTGSGSRTGRGSHTRSPCAHDLSLLRSRTPRPASRPGAEPPPPLDRAAPPEPPTLEMRRRHRRRIGRRGRRLVLEAELALARLLLRAAWVPWRPAWPSPASAASGSAWTRLNATVAGAGVGVARFCALRFGLGLRLRRLRLGLLVDDGDQRRRRDRARHHARRGTDAAEAQPDRRRRRAEPPAAGGDGVDLRPRRAAAPATRTGRTAPAGARARTASRARSPGRPRSGAGAGGSRPPARSWPCRPRARSAPRRSASHASPDSISPNTFMNRLRPSVIQRFTFVYDHPKRRRSPGRRGPRP